ncbi:hypothetical protein C8A01DRAFT_12900 [Parachaetomium inaequale]|uniref:Myb-like DNA-binding domain-containing protein n=1 Tax=Parachaetomium inaequale TaxID=2588326 RepID=A0AAN6SVF8_9PEZI|nr:hypothetical protein C8A01DRAFT_12900 [Parachaetomium inaequale]
MPPKTTAAKAAAAGDPKQPSAQEAYLFYTIIKNMKGKPDIDWAAVATDAGFKNAETAKVRYGQIKRKLGLDNWTGGKPPVAKEPTKDDEAAGAPETPATNRTKKTAATPGTGSGVKKRASTTKRASATPGSRSRKAKSQALIKMEEDAEQANDQDEDELMLDQNQLPETPTKKFKKGGAAARRIKSEFGSESNAPNMNPGDDIANEFATFPAVLPESVIERRAILVDVSGTWTLAPATVDVHAQWLARLPAHVQTIFYGQAHSAAKNNNNAAARNGGDGVGNANANGNSFILPEENMNINDASATSAQQFISEHFNNATAGGMQLPTLADTMMPAMGMGMGGEAGNVDLHSIPMHPAYFEQLQREREERDQAERDQQLLFGGGHGGGGDGQDDFN